jgi:4-amino-4-deoxy-L-arabinose transferase-like glycosyltransferase
MTALLPVVAFIILYYIFHRSDDRCWRSSVLSAAIIWGLCLTIVTEVLSIGNSITFNDLAGTWVAIDIFLIYKYVRAIEQKQQSYTRQSEPKLSRFSILLVYCVVAIVLSVGIVAIAARPNNWDSMTYHLPRVMHWIQNHHVGYYPTNYLPQLYQKPWTEYVILHLQILSGGDRLANLVQWFSSIGSIIGVSLIAKHLGTDARGQIFTTVACATIPMGILQSSSTKNDYVLCFWLTCLVYNILLAVNGKTSSENSFKIGVCLGLAILTKGTAYIYILPFLIWLLVSGVEYSIGTWQQLITPLILATAIDLGQMLRNLQLFGNIFTTGDEKYLNDAFSLPILISSIIKNISLHIFIPVAPVRDALDRAIRTIHTFLGVNIDDARLSWPGTTFSLPDATNFLAEDSAPNSVHLLAIAATIIICLTWRRLRKQQILITYISLTLIAFLLFCLLLKWQPWHSRLHLSLFVLFAAPVGIVLANLPQRRLVNSIVVLLIISSLPWCLFGRSRPLIARLEPLTHGSIENVFNTSDVDRYFANQQLISGPYVGATDYIKSQNCQSVGLALNPDTWEYPFWVLLQKDTNQNVYINHVNPQNISIIKAKEDPYKDFTPCAIIAVNDRGNREIFIPAGNYVKTWSNAPVSVFLKH